jgi:hypothetical protein
MRSVVILLLSVAAVLAFKPLRLPIASLGRLSTMQVRYAVDDNGERKRAELPKWLTKADGPPPYWLLSDDLPPWFDSEFGPPKWMVKKKFNFPDWLVDDDLTAAMVVKSYGKHGPPDWLLKMDSLPEWFDDVEKLPEWLLAYRDQPPPEWALEDDLPSWLTEGRIPAWMYDENIVSKLEEFSSESELPDWCKEASSDDNV